MSNKINLQVFALGKPGTGKTTVLKKRLEEELLRAGFKLQKTDFGVLLSTPRVFLHDPAREWSEIMGLPVKDLADGWAYPYTRCETVEELLQVDTGLEPCFFVFDELMLVDRAHYAALTELCVLRRHRRIAIFAGSQRPAKIPKEVLALSNSLYVFALSDRDDLLKLKNLLTAEQSARVPRLKVGEFVEVSSV